MNAWVFPCHPVMNMLTMKTVLHKKEEEYRLADRLLCPSDFVASTFLEHGFAASKLVRHQYGFDEKVYFQKDELRGGENKQGLTVIICRWMCSSKGFAPRLASLAAIPGPRRRHFSNRRSDSYLVMPSAYPHAYPIQVFACLDIDKMCRS